MPDFLRTSLLAGTQNIKHLVIAEFGSRNTKIKEDALGWRCGLELLDCPLDVSCIVGAHSL